MSNPSFDIDDILNEINKRREEIEKEINSVSIESLIKESEAVQRSPEPKKAEEVKAEEPVAERVAVEKPEPVKAPAEVKAPIVAEKEPEPEEQEVAEEPKTEEKAEEPKEYFDRHDENAASFDETDKLFDSADKNDSEKSFKFDEKAFAEFTATPVSRKRTKEKSEKKWNKTKKGKILISVIVILAISIVGALGFGYFYFEKILDDITVDPNTQTDNTKTEEWHGMDELVVNFTDIYETTDIYSYRDFAKTWYYNGDPCSSTNILNVLLIGEDTRGDEIMEEDTLADSVIIASVNTETNELILSSILRDTYAYYELVPGDETTGTYGKLNEAMSQGNLSAYINAVERIYKVNIDNYVLVNFSNFKKIIDSLGGVTVEMTAAEIREINNNPGRYGNVYIEGDAGVKQLNGSQALAYSRIRYIDSDIYRSERQRTVLLDVFYQLKDASITRLTRVATNLLPYVKTGFTKGEILSIGKYGFSRGWLGYNIITHTVPINETRADGTVLNVWTDDDSYGYSTLKVDFPLAAQVLQEKIYGRTNIILAENRPNFRYLSAY